jgi:hypothetical protein
MITKHGRGSVERSQKPISPGLVPWLLPAFFVLVVLAFGALPLLGGAALVLLVLGAICVTLYRATENMDYVQMRREDPLYRGFDDFRRGRGYRGLDSDSRAD